MWDSPASGGFTAGSTIAGYLLQEQIGRGGMAVVFRAHDERLDRTVALKILAPAFAGEDAFRQRFIRESRAAAAVDDPHIIPVFEAGEESGVLFIAMRYVRGGDVGTAVRRGGRLQVQEAAAIVSQVASALDAAHARGLVHRDVKPANMLLDAGGDAGRPDHVYLSDFGLSKGQLTAAKITTTGQFLGTLDYMSPEQVDGKHVGAESDQYSLACAAFELLTGAPPFERDTAMAVMYAHLHEAPPTVTSRRPELPGGADAVFARALAKAPAERYASCQQFAEALREALGLAPYRGQAAGQAGVPGGRPPRSAAASARPADGQHTVVSTPAALTELATGQDLGLEPAMGPAPPGAPWRRSRLVIIAAVAIAALGGGTALLLSRGGGASPLGTVIFKSEFSGTADGWQVLQDPAAGHLSNGAYYIRATSSGNGETGVPKNASSVYPSAPADIRIDVSARAVSGPLRSVQYGIVCRDNGSGAYLFQVQGDRATIAKFAGGNYLPLTSVSAPAVSVGAANQLSAECTSVGQAARLTFSVNGARLLQVTDRGSPLEGGTVGVFTNFYAVSAPNGVAAAFQDFVVRQL